MHALDGITALEKAKQFDAFLQEEQISSFEKREIEDDEHTIVYRSFIQTGLGDMPIFLLIDDTIYSVIRVLMGSKIVTDENRNDILEFMNEANSNYKNFKIYLEDVDQSVYLDCVNQSSMTHFDPRLLYVLMTQIVDYLKENYSHIGEAFHVTQVPNPFVHEG